MDMAENSSLTWYIFKLLSGAAGFLLVLVSCQVAVALSLDAAARFRRQRRGKREGRSGIYAGRVWHARVKPTAHRFSYPIFYCLLDLDELDVAFPWYIWPVGSASASAWLPALSRFRSSDHLKGKGKGKAEGKGGDRPKPAGGSTEDDGNIVAGGAMSRAGRGALSGGAPMTSTSPSALPLAGRIRDIVEEATGVRPTGRVQLLTHLAYLGYCFNPVSFYYCLDVSEREIETVVAEVSNTPWGEMHCYVLNPKTRGVQVLSEDGEGEGVKGLVRYRFEKNFHVSPFMSMQHTYDWKFTAPDSTPGSALMAQTTLLEQDGGKVFFDAKLVLKRQPCFSAAALCWHMTVYPLYTVWVQVLIHYQAFRLWSKQVPFFPHPEGAETAASKLVAMIMTPLFNAQAAWDKGSRRRDRDGSIPSSGNGTDNTDDVARKPKSS